MSFVEEYLGLERVLGSHTFTAEDIVRFAEKFDPQPFHVDAEAAKSSLFGGLCASGWHVTAVFMKLNVASLAAELRKAAERGEKLPVFGPSPGFENLAWLKPVFPGDTLTYRRTAKKLRPLVSRPGWSMLTFFTTADNQRGEQVLRFESAAMVKLPD